MILRDIERQIAAKQPEGFVYPQYDGYCFSNIPSAIQYLFGLKSNSPLSVVLDKAGIQPGEDLTIVALLIDGFGYNQWLRYAEKYEFLRRFTENGAVAPVTAVFPSTTAASLTTIHSGLTPQEHGLPEWWVYFEELGQVVVTLPFRPLGGHIQDELLLYGADPKILFDGDTLYGALAESGVPSFNLIHDPISGSAYSSLILSGSEVVPFSDGSDLMARLTGKIGETRPPAYVHVYWDKIDGAAHEHGLHSSQYLAQLDRFFALLTDEFLDRLPSTAAKHSVLLIMADHGQVSVDPEATIYLNDYPELTDCLRTGRGGESVLPWGSARDVFLSVKPERLDEALELLSDALGDRATVVKTETAFKDGLFGRGQPHREFKNRIGDILILPHGNLTLWYERPYHKRFTMLGMHGGLSPDEMLVPFAAARLSELT